MSDTIIVDIHTHTYPDEIAEKTVAKLGEVAGIDPHTDGTTRGLAESCKTAGIDYALVLPVATSPHQEATINKSAYKINLSSGRKGLLSFGAIHPDSPDYKRVIRGIASLGLKGIKLHPDYQGVFFDDIRYKRIIDAASEQGLYIVVHAGVDIGIPDPVHTTPAMVREVLRDTGSDRLILAHMGGWRLWDEVMDQLVGEDVRLDTSFSTPAAELPDMLDEERFIEMVRAFGADRILFGSDSPWASQRKSLKWIEHTSLRREEKEKILGKNAAEILKLKKR
ncbi:MAG: amidohydrolase family protein [Eubacterium sp.]|nr:amidohydrolase family protein [Eubacterium sp.]